MARTLQNPASNGALPELNPTQLKALEYLFAARTIGEVAVALKVSRDTITVWQKLPAWVREWNLRLERARYESRQRSIEGLAVAQNVLLQLAQGEGDIQYNADGTPKRRGKGKDAPILREPVPYSVRLGAASKLYDVKDSAYDPLPEPGEKREKKPDEALLRGLAIQAGYTLVKVEPTTGNDSEGYSPEDAAPGNKE